MDLITVVPIVIEAISGPASATVLLALLIGGAIYAIVKYIIPLIKSLFDEQKKALKAIMLEHREDREMFQKAFVDLTGEIKSLSQNSEKIIATLDKHHNRLEDIERKMK